MIKVKEVDNQEMMVGQCSALGRRKFFNATVSAALQRGKNNIR
jgi:hypothetical protein